jgi:Holliday junction resolvase RusA-like endonuclease
MNAKSSSKKKSTANVAPPPEYWPKNKKGKKLPLVPKQGFYRPDESAFFSFDSEYIQLTLSGQPQPKERYATSPHGNKWNSSWKPEEDIAVSTAALCDSIQKSAFLFKHDIPLCLDVKFVFSDKNTWYGRPRPDLDNLCKIVMDALNGIVYQDDNQFVKLVAEKKTSKTRANRTVITISKYVGSLEDEDDDDIA